MKQCDLERFHSYCKVVENIENFTISGYAIYPFKKISSSKFLIYIKKYSNQYGFTECNSGVWLPLPI
jgi:hypothetical protein